LKLLIVVLFEVLAGCFLLIQQFLLFRRIGLDLVFLNIQQFLIGVGIGVIRLDRQRFFKVLLTFQVWVGC